MAKSNPAGIISLIGGVLAVIGVFMEWVDGLGFTGWDYFDILSKFDGAPTSVYVPLFIVILGAIAAIIALLDIAGAGGGRLLPFIIGILVIVLPFWMFMDIYPSMTIADILDTLNGIGFYLLLAGGVIMIIGAPISASRAKK